MLSKTFELSQAHSSTLTHLDYNINKPNTLISSGKDCYLKVWDTRQLQNPLLEVSDHSHWIWCVGYNKFHDQLVITSSSDMQINLQNLVSVSSCQSKKSEKEILEQLQEQNGSSDAISEEDFINKTTDSLVMRYDHHEESIYSCAWSAADPWIFAAVSYDGILSINCVPSSHKYKIIL